MRERIKTFLSLLSCSNNSSDSGNSILRCKYFLKYVFLILIFYNKAVKRKDFIIKSITRSLVIFQALLKTM